MRGLATRNCVACDHIFFMENKICFQSCLLLLLLLWISANFRPRSSEDQPRLLTWLMLTLSHSVQLALPIQPGQSGQPGQPSQARLLFSVGVPKRKPLTALHAASIQFTTQPFWTVCPRRDDLSAPLYPSFLESPKAGTQVCHTLILKWTWCVTEQSSPPHTHTHSSASSNGFTECLCREA